MVVLVAVLSAVGELGFYGLLMVGGLVVRSVDGRRAGFPQRIGAETCLVARLCVQEGAETTSWRKTLAETGLSERFPPLPFVRGGFLSLRGVSASVFCHEHWGVWVCVGGLVTRWN
ncbi:hypothetical protein BHAP_1496 [Bifidobacterium hapali]|uniref:Uncharacterized protein n=1 Tax=Bifidobacterium hapali TaxID=1630172 RepID=A0A261FYF9_9BIFI|nr:hypothetical protein BHAP_1496 [Bifidobacterium hapali]